MRKKSEYLELSVPSIELMIVKLGPRTDLFLFLKEIKKQFSNYLVK